MSFNQPLPIQFIPLAEAAVRPGGRVSIKIVGPGWGSSAYYPAEVLERDGPAIFTAGTRMFWNHDTAEEAAARPEGDLDRYAAKLTTNAYWDEAGPAGPGLYAEAQVFKEYQQRVEEKRPEVSLRALGRAVMGEAEGRTGPIVQELLAARSVDWVTAAGAGGQIVTLEEAARPQPTAVELQEAHNLAEWLEAQLHLHLTALADDMFGWGYVNRVERKSLSAAIGAALDTYHEHLRSQAPQLFERGRWETAPAAEDEADAMSEAEIPPLEDSMSTEQLQEAQRRIAALEEEARNREAAVGRMQEQLLLREARDFVHGRLAQSGLPELTRLRLVRELATNPPLTEAGRIDEAAYGQRVDTAVQEAAAEVAAIASAGALAEGQITGMGTAAPADSAPTVSLEEAEKRIQGALGNLGYRPVA